MISKTGKDLDILLTIKSFYMKSFFITLFLGCSIFASAQNKVVGVISDKQNLPISAVNISIPELHKETISDENGKYSIELNPGNYTIQFSSVGYEPFEKTVTIKTGAVTTINGYIGSGNYTLKDVVAETLPTKNTYSEIIAEVK